MGPQSTSGSRRRRGVAGGIAVALTMLVAVLGLQMPVAQGALHGPIPADASGDPQDLFVQQDPLFAYVRSDTAGGYICVVKPGVEGCDSPAFGRATFVLSVGTTFVLLHSGEMPSGTYQLAVENSLRAPLETSETFTVSECADCDRTVAQQVAQEFKAAAGRSATNFSRECTFNDVLEKVAGKATGMRGFTKSATLRHVNYTTDQGVFVATPDGSGTTFTFTDPFTANINKAFDILHDVSCGVAKMYADIAADPPDPNFQQVQQPVLATFPPIGPPGLDRLVRTVDKEGALAEALLHGYEKYQGALAAHDAAASELQLRATGEFAIALSAEMDTTARALDTWAGAASGDPELNGVMLASADVAALHALDRRVVDQGFTGAEIDTAHAAGYTDADLAGIRPQFDRDLSLIPADTTYPDALRQVAENLRAEIDSVAAFGDAALVAASNFASANTPPSADFLRTPSSGVAPLRVAFDASGSTDADGAIASYAWDFGDGTGGSGRTTSHTYVTPGTHTAVLTVTDSGGATDAIRGDVTVTSPTPANQPPTATISAFPASGNVPLDVVLDGAGSSDVDGTVVSYEWDFGDGATASGRHVTHTFIGERNVTVTLTVTDDDGATAIAATTVSTVRKNTPPVVSLDVTPASGSAPLDVTFTDTTQDPEGDPIVSRTWLFWDSSVSGNETSQQRTLTGPGTYTMSLIACDDRGLCGQTSRTVVVDTNTPGNNKPVAVDDAATVRQGKQTVLFTLGNDTDVDSDSLQMVTFTASSHGHAECSPSFCTYTSADGYVGPDSFGYTVSDGRGGTATATVEVTVTADAAPVAVDDALETSRGLAATVSVLDNDTDPDSDPLTFVDWTPAGHGSVACSPPGGCTYTPASGFTGTDFFEYTIADDLGLTAQGRVDISVLSNRLPRPGDDQFTYHSVQAFDVLANDGDPDQQMLHVTGTSPPGHGSVACSATGACLYRPDQGSTTDDVFTYTVEDTEGGARDATVSLVFQAQTFRPLSARPDTVGTDQGAVAEVDVLANDQPATGLTLTDWSVPAHGAVTCGSAGRCTYTPRGAFSGFDAFTYTATDGSSSVVGSVRVSVVPADAEFTVSAAGASSSVADPAGTLAAGHRARWAVGARSNPAGLDGELAHALPAPKLVATLDGAHDLVGASVTAAPGWTATRTATTVSGEASAGALLGESTQTELPPPLPPVSQGTGGDGHVPILVGGRVYAFFHHSYPTSISCVDRATGELCPGYPRLLAVAATDAPGSAEVIGTKIYVRLASSSFYEQTAPVGLFCWDTATAEPCGWTIFERVRTTMNLYASPPQLVDGKLWVASPTGMLHCLDPQTGAVCPSVPTGIPASASPAGTFVDAVHHGNRVYVGQEGSVACVDVTGPGPCEGWAEPATISNASVFDVITRHAPDGTPDGVCLAQPSVLTCWADAGGPPEDHVGWPGADHYYFANSQAEVGPRTYLGSFNSGLVCWDWSTMAACEGGDLSNGSLTTDVNGDRLPSAYGAAFDGTCVVGLGDPGLVFTVDPRGFSPCTSLTSGNRRVVDLRDQRCDGTVGAARWGRVTVLDADLAPGTQFVSMTVIVRDAETGAVLLQQEMVGGPGTVDLAGIDPSTHPGLVVQAASQSVDGAPAWADGVSPRVQLSWDGDPAQLCFQTATVVSCSAVGTTGDVSVGGRLQAGPAVVRSLALRTPGGCVSRTPNRPPAAVDDTMTGAEDDSGSVGVLGNDTDADADVMSVTGTSAAVGGTVSCAAAGACLFTPATDLNGPASFDYTVSDGQGGTATAHVLVTITPVNDPPVAADDSVSMDADTTLAPDVLVNDSAGPADEAGQVLVVDAVVTQPANGTATVQQGRLRYTPDADFQGADSLAYRVCDDGLTGTQPDPRCDTAAVHFTVRPGGRPAVQVDEPPAVGLATPRQVVQYSDEVAFTATVADADTAAADLVVTATGLPDGLTFASTGPGAWVVRGNVQAAPGEYPMTVSAADATSRRSATLTVVVLREDAEPAYVGDTLHVVTGPATSVTARLKAQVRQSPASDLAPADLTRAVVYFDVTSADAPVSAAPDRVIGPVPVGADGIAQADTALGEGVWRVQVRLDPASAWFVGPLSAPGLLTVHRPTPSSLTGGGWIRNGGPWANFGFTVAATADGSPRGTATYVWRTRHRVHIARMSSWAGGSLRVSADGTHATFTGKATVTTTDRDGPHRVRDGFTMRVRVVEGGAGRGRTGAYAVTLRRHGTRFHRSDPEPVRIRGGTVVIGGADRARVV